ncbi:hypothetical protein [Cognaticolwellia aestuarii]|uniref:hypothetical protein n=1 Tax=Cognaticolwellia aestuarii TaxID=329993 RepID=UPI0009861E1F|nr:hypothetical protein [Cognaticolwellia aestuarii]
MRTKILALLLFGFPGLTLSASSYEVSVIVKDAKSMLNFPSFEILSFGHKGTTQTGDCTYSGMISQEDETAILLEGQMSCINEDGESYMDMPEFVLSTEGGSASIELGDDEADMWKYTVEVKARN